MEGDIVRGPVKGWAASPAVFPAGEPNHLWIAGNRAHFPPARLLRRLTTPPKLQRRARRNWRVDRRQRRRLGLLDRPRRLSILIV